MYIYVPVCTCIHTYMHTYISIYTFIKYTPGQKKGREHKVKKKEKTNKSPKGGSENQLQTKKNITVININMMTKLLNQNVVRIQTIKNIPVIAMKPYQR